MGVYIKNMEMPTSCYHCVWMFRDKPNGKVYCTATETNSNIFAADQWLDVSDVLAENRHLSCPLVPVPPHGRLIDAADAVETAWMILRGLGYRKEENPQLEQTVREVFATAPTIEVE